MCGSTMDTIKKHCEDRLEIFEGIEFELEKLLDLKGMRKEPRKQTSYKDEQEFNKIGS